jgi:hypothetical protein
MAMNTLWINKKGFTYLLVTSFMVAVILLIFFTTSNYKYQDQEALQQVRIRAMNDFMRNLDNDIHRATYISAFRALLTLETYLIDTKQFGNTSVLFREAFFDGTIYGGVVGDQMVNSTFSEYLSRVQDLAASTGILLDINVTSIRLAQHDPWSLDVYMMMNITAIDTKNTASWHINKEYVTNVPIDTLKDPIYIKHLPKAAVEALEGIRRANTTLVNGSDVSNLKTHITGFYYINSTFAPSYMMRLEDNITRDPDGNGIESIVDVKFLTDQGVVITQSDLKKIKVDYIYFDSVISNETKVCNVSGISQTDYNFVIPLNRTSMYQISGLNYSTSPICPD